MADMSWLTDLLNDLVTSTNASITTNIPGDPQWDDIDKLMGMDAKMNRFNRSGAFSSWDWTEDPETGQWTQTQNMGPEMEAGRQRMFDRIGGEGFDEFNSPEQFNSLLDAKMSNQMDRHGILSETPDLNREFGQGSADQYAGVEWEQPQYPMDPVIGENKPPDGENNTLPWDRPDTGIVVGPGETPPDDTGGEIPDGYYRDPVTGRILPIERGGGVKPGGPGENIIKSYGGTGR